MLLSGALVLALNAGQRGRREGRADEAHWFAGLVYFNRGVLERYGSGLAWVMVPVVVGGAGGRR